MLRSEPMTKTLLCLTALLILTGCRSTARIKATPLKEQKATQVTADRKKCDEWSKSAGSVLNGYAACLVAARALSDGGAGRLRPHDRAAGCDRTPAAAAPAEAGAALHRADPRGVHADRDLRVEREAGRGDPLRCLPPVRHAPPSLHAARFRACRAVLVPHGRGAA